MSITRPFKTDSHMMRPNVNIDKQTLSPEDLLEGLRTDGKYGYLQVILSKNNNCKTGQQYLVCSPLGFGVYKLLDIDYHEGKIMMTLRNTDTDDIVEESLDIYDRSKKFFLICWNDIKQMVYKSKASDHSNTDLLEFNF